MRPFLAPALLILTVLPVAPSHARQPGASSISTTNLRCEYLTNPLAIDTPKPRLSWEDLATDPNARALTQSAYQIIVGASADDLARDKASLWDSGQVSSATMNQIEYGGPRLRPRTTAYWKVRVWDGAGRVSAWSQPATWTAGLTSPVDWSNARWIGDPTPPPPTLKANNGYHSALAQTAEAGGWVAVALAEPAAVDAVKLFPARPYDRRPDTPGFLFPVRFKVEVATKADFSDAVTVADRTTGDVPNPRTEPLAIAFPPAPARYVRLSVTRTTPRDGDRNFAFALAELQVLSGGKLVSQGATATAKASIENAEWSTTHLTDGDLQSHGVKGYDPLPAPMLRKAFQVPSGGGAVTRATLCVTALGLYDARLNGAPIGDHVLAPEWTDYHKRIQYQAYDLTAQIKPGANCLAVTLGDGWYAGKIGLTQIVPGGPSRAIYGRQPRLLLRLAIDRENGPTQDVISDETWKTTLEGPTRQGDLLDGDTYDARREIPGWDTPTFNDSSWSSAATAPAPPGARLVAQPNQPIRVTRELAPVTVTEPKPRAFVVDMGQNMVGRLRARLRGAPGLTVTLRHAEVLNSDGTIYTTNLRGAAQTDSYTFRSDQEETFEPRFTYHGFRYVEITGLPAMPTPDQITGRAFNSDCPEVGTFECSDPMVNRLRQNILWTQRANLTGVPTDCPQRDERCGWTGDILAFAPTACFNMDMAAFLTKWMGDMRDDQAADGRFPDFAPQPFDPNARFSGVPAWADAGVFVPWTVYQFYGDTRILADNYDAAARWVEFVNSKNPDHLWKNARANDYGDWLNADTLKLSGWPAKGAEIPKEVFATMFFFRSAQTVSKMAGVLNRPDDAAKYRTLADSIREAFVRTYVHPDALLEGDTQAGYALALQFGLLPKDLEDRALARAIDRFKPYNGQISTGFHSTLPLMVQLSARGHNDEAYRLLLNRNMPSWGYEIDHGATTVWERWDGYVEGRGFQDPGMNSFAHYAIGAVGEWMFGTMLGIQPESPGFETISIRPHPAPGVAHASAAYRSLRGTITSSWEQAGPSLSISVSIPPNTSAMLQIPAPANCTWSGGDNPLVESPGIRPALSTTDVRVRLGSGRYHFVASR